MKIPNNARYLNLDSTGALIASCKTNLQQNSTSRITIDNKILTVSVNKNDIDASTKSRDRRRNEISCKMLELGNGESGMWGGEFKLNQHVKPVNDGWYHILQVKYNDNLKTFKDCDRSVPPFTFSLFNDYLCMRPNLNRGYVPIALIKDVVDTWIPFKIELDNSKNGVIKWYTFRCDTGSKFEQTDDNIDDITLQMKEDIKNKKITKLYKCGTYTCKDLGTVDVKNGGGIYFKCGQYMSADYDLNQTYSTSYRSLWCA